MAEPFVGQIMPVAFNYAPQDYAFCNGTTLAINQFTALFSLLGTQFGGNGQTTFQLPALNGRMACGTGTGPGLSPRNQGQAFGAATVTLDQTQMPGHVHIGNAVAASRGTARSEPRPRPLLSPPVRAWRPMRAGRSTGPWRRPRWHPWAAASRTTTSSRISP